MNASVIAGFFKTYGWQLSCLALTGMIVLGFLKWVGCFKKLPTNCKKYVYYAISCALSIIACTVYVLINKAFDWVNWGILCGAVIVFCGAIYTIWENSGLRAVWKKVVLDSISKLFGLITTSIVNGTLTKEKISQEAVNLGSETLAQLYREAKALEDSKKETK